MAATWPNVHIPAPKGPTAAEHMKHISKAAHDAASKLTTDIDKAIEACQKGECLHGDPPQRGKPPADAAHGTSILAARNSAGSPADWDECLAALRHGEPTQAQEQTRRSRSPGA